MGMDKVKTPNLFKDKSVGAYIGKIKRGSGCAVDYLITVIS